MIPVASPVQMVVVFFAPGVVILKMTVAMVAMRLGVFIVRVKVMSSRARMVSVSTHLTNVMVKRTARTPQTRSAVLLEPVRRTGNGLNQ